jgi:hypothetical protein
MDSGHHVWFHNKCSSSTGSANHVTHSRQAARDVSAEFLRGTRSKVWSLHIRAEASLSRSLSQRLGLNLLVRLRGVGADAEALNGLALGGLTAGPATKRSETSEGGKETDEMRSVTCIAFLAYLHRALLTSKDA